MNSVEILWIIHKLLYDYIGWEEIGKALKRSVIQKRENRGSAKKNTWVGIKHLKV